jgi:hypothetical protein
VSGMERPNYNVHVYKDGKWWMVEIPEIDGLTQARHLREADDMARDYIAATLDIPEDSFTLAMSIEVGAEAQRHIDAAKRLRKEADEAAQRASEESRTAARCLAAAGLPLRDVSVVLGVSYQRVHQLVG